jgi:hypothetical protein
MIMADILMYFLFIAGAYIIFISYWLLAEALFPKLVEHCQSQYAGTPVRSTVIGFAVAAPLVLAGFGLITHMGNPIFQITGFAILILILTLGLFGSAGLCRQIGHGLAVPHDDRQPWRRVLRGGLVLGLTFVLPIVGWFGVLPWALISGFGACLRTAYGRRKTKRAVSAV